MMIERDYENMKKVNDCCCTAPAQDDTPNIHTEMQQQQEMLLKASEILSGICMRVTAEGCPTGEIADAKCLTEMMESNHRLLANLCSRLDKLGRVI